MRFPRVSLVLGATLVLGCVPLVSVSADDGKPGKSAKSARDETTARSHQDEIPTYDLLEAMKKGLVDVEAKGEATAG